MSLYSGLELDCDIHVRPPVTKAIHQTEVLDRREEEDGGQSQEEVKKGEGEKDKAAEKEGITHAFRFRPASLRRPPPPTPSTAHVHASHLSSAASFLPLNAASIASVDLPQSLIPSHSTTQTQTQTQTIPRPAPIRIDPPTASMGHQEEKVLQSSDTISNRAHAGSGSLAPTLPTGVDYNDVNDFQSSGPANQKARSRKKKKTGQGTGHGWNDVYDPARPAIYEEFVEFRAQQKERRREEEEREKNWSREREDAAYPESHQPHQPQFHPPASYDSPPRARSPGPSHPSALESERDRELERARAKTAVQINRQETADEIYARRLSMSQQASQTAVPQAASLIQSSDPHSLNQPPPLSTQPTPSVMSASVSVIPPSDEIERKRKAALALAASFALAPVVTSGSQNEIVAEKIVEEEDDQEMMDFLAEIDEIPEDEEADIVKPKKRKKEQEMSIGKKIMLGQGYVEGQGLGADGSGIANALSIARNKPAKKKEKEKEVVLSGFKKAAGAIIDRNLAAQNLKSVEAYGEPSRTIQLSKLVDRADVDDDLSEEIGEECGKHGNVLRVWIPSGDSIDAPISVMFSGPAAAWTARQALDGRLFAGKAIVARFVPDP